MILPLLKGIPLKAFAYAAILSLVLGAVWTAYNKVWTAGYNSAQLELQEETIKAANAAVEHARKQWEASAAAAESQIIVEEKIVEKIRVIEKEIPVVVEGVAPKCRDLGPDVLRLFNDAINATGDQRKDPPAAP